MNFNTFHQCLESSEIWYTAGIRGVLQNSPLHGTNLCIICCRSLLPGNGTTVTLLSASLSF